MSLTGDAFGPQNVLGRRTAYTAHEGHPHARHQQERYMALIEHLEDERWEGFFQNTFRYALEVMKHDRFRSVGVPRTT